MYRNQPKYVLFNKIHPCTCKHWHLHAYQSIAKRNNKREKTATKLKKNRASAQRALTSRPYYVCTYLVEFVCVWNSLNHCIPYNILLKCIYLSKRARCLVQESLHWECTLNVCTLIAALSAAECFVQPPFNRECATRRWIQKKKQQAK